MIFTVYSSLFETALALFYSYQLMQDQLGSYVLAFLFLPLASKFKKTFSLCFKHYSVPIFR